MRNSILAVLAASATFLPSSVTAELGTGVTAPDITEALCGPNGLTGRQFDLSRDGNGKVVYLQFNNPACSRCRHLVATVQESVYPSFRDNPHVVFVQVAYAYAPYCVDDVVDMIAATGCTQNVLAEENGDAYGAYEITGIPYSFVIDRTGVIRYSKGGMNIPPGEVAEEISKALAGVTPPARTPMLELACNAASLIPGDRVCITAEVSGVARTFDAYALIRRPDGAWLSMTLSGALRPGIAPVAANVGSHTHAARYTLLDAVVPPGAPEGAYEVIAGLAGPGTLDAFCEERLAEEVGRATAGKR